MKTRVVAVDIRLERTTTAIIDVRGSILARDEFPTGDSANVGDFTSLLSENIVNLVENNGGYESIRSIGICCPSANFMTGCIENAPNLPSTEQNGLACRNVTIQNCTIEGNRGICCNYDSKNKKYQKAKSFHGRDGFAGEIGHTCAKLDGRQCACGNKGCLEMYTSAKGVVQTAQELLAESDAPSMMRQVEHLSSSTVSSLCNCGDALAIETMRRTGYWLGYGLAKYASIINPEAIVLTGGVIHAGDYLLEPMEASFNAHVFHNIEGKVKFLVTQFKESEANLLGASVLAWQVKEYSLFK